MPAGQGAYNRARPPRLARAMRHPDGNRHWTQMPRQELTHCRNVSFSPPVHHRKRFGSNCAPTLSAALDHLRASVSTPSSAGPPVPTVRAGPNEQSAQCPQRTEIRRLSAPSGMAGRSAPWPVGTVTGRSPPSIGASVSCSGRALRHHLDRPAVNAQPCSEPIDRKPLTQPPQRRSAEPRGNRRIPEPMPMTPAHRRNRASKRRRSSPHPRTHPRKPHRNAHAGNQSTSCPVDRP